MGFGLCNAPATFQAMMNFVLQPHLRKFVVVFLDDILIFSKTWDEHLDHIRVVLQTLRDHKLFCKPSKCMFRVTEILYLGHLLTGTSISPDPKKLEAVESWPTPQTVTQVRSFLGFTNYFRRFIQGYADLFTDNQAVVYLRTKPHLSKREERWVAFLAEKLAPVPFQTFRYFYR